MSRREKLQIEKASHMPMITSQRRTGLVIKKDII
jgi:hypothetical protein